MTPPLPVPRLLDTLPAKIFLWEEFYFMPVSEPLHQRAVELAEQISRVSRGKRTVLLCENSEVVGKIGEFVVREFCQQYLHCPWRSLVEEVNSQGGDRSDLQIIGLNIDVKTRSLNPDPRTGGPHADITIASNFDLRIAHDSRFPPRHQDIYILAGYCPSTRYGYCFGWATWAEVQSRPIRDDIKYPARCIPLRELHPMLELERYIHSQLPPIPQIEGVSFS